MPSGSVVGTSVSKKAVPVAIACPSFAGRCVLELSGMVLVAEKRGVEVVASACFCGSALSLVEPCDSGAGLVGAVGVTTSSFLTAWS